MQAQAVALSALAQEPSPTRWSCVVQDPTARPTARDLLQHSWITFNRRTLKSSWSRTRGLKTRAGGPLAGECALAGLVVVCVWWCGGVLWGTYGGRCQGE